METQSALYTPSEHGEKKSQKMQLTLYLIGVSFQGNIRIKNVNVHFDHHSLLINFHHRINLFR